MSYNFGYLGWKSSILRTDDLNYQVGFELTLCLFFGFSEALVRTFFSYIRYNGSAIFLHFDPTWVFLLLYSSLILLLKYAGVAGKKILLMYGYCLIFRSSAFGLSASFRSDFWRIISCQEGEKGPMAFPYPTIRLAAGGQPAFPNGDPIT